MFQATQLPQSLERYVIFVSVTKTIGLIDSTDSLPRSPFRGVVTTHKHTHARARAHARETRAAAHGEFHVAESTSHRFLSKSRAKGPSEMS